MILMCSWEAALTSEWFSLSFFSSIGALHSVPEALDNGLANTLRASELHWACRWWHCRLHMGILHLLGGLHVCEFFHG